MVVAFPEPSNALPREWPARRRTEKLVGLSLIVSGSVHGSITQDHFKEWWGYGLFFMAAAVCLIVFGLALTTDAIDSQRTPGDVHKLRRIMYFAGLVGTIALLALYALTRTAGIPFGPGAGTVETVAVPDVVANVTEVAAAFGLILLLWKARSGVTLARRR